MRHQVLLIAALAAVISFSAVWGQGATGPNPDGNSAGPGPIPGPPAGPSVAPSPSPGPTPTPRTIAPSGAGCPASAPGSKGVSQPRKQTYHIEYRAGRTVFVPDVPLRNQVAQLQKRADDTDRLGPYGGDSVRQQGLTQFLENGRVATKGWVESRFQPKQMATIPPAQTPATGDVNVQGVPWTLLGILGGLTVAALLTWVIWSLALRGGEANGRRYRGRKANWKRTGGFKPSEEAENVVRESHTKNTDEREIIPGDVAIQLAVERRRRAVGIAKAAAKGNKKPKVVILPIGSAPAAATTSPITIPSGGMTAAEIAVLLTGIGVTGSSSSSSSTTTTTTASAAPKVDFTVAVDATTKEVKIAVLYVGPKLKKVHVEWGDTKTDDGPGPDFAHTYATAATFKVKVTAEDDDSTLAKAKASHDVVVT